jgi:2-polyprenyl-3-methyl-5-hydroxy-6-metoxy-1,4-benzoquinol methylase
MATFDNRAIIAAWAAATDHLDDFEDEGDFTRQHLLNPVIFELLGSVAGRTILDAGCGQGYLCRLLAKRGARVTGVEPAAPWYQKAVAWERRDPLGISYVQADLSTGAALGCFDAVVANMALMDIPDYVPAMRRCIASLVPGGDFIFSLSHPCFEEPSAAWGGKGYVEVREYLAEYTIPQTFAPRFHRPLSHYLNQTIDAGCMLQRLVEPQLAREWARLGPAYERNLHVPSVLVVHARRS